MDEDPTGATHSRLRRVVSDPLRLRRYARATLALATLASAFGWWLFAGTARSLLLAVGWIILPFIAVGIAAGDAFFIEHGRGVRRAVLTLALGALVGIASCALINSVSTGAGSRSALAEGCAYALLYAAATLCLAAALALAIGRGAGYVARRIQQVDDEGW